MCALTVSAVLLLGTYLTVFVSSCTPRGTCKNITSVIGSSSKAEATQTSSSSRMDKLGCVLAREYYISMKMNYCYLPIEGLITTLKVSGPKGHT